MSYPTKTEPKVNITTSVEVSIRDNVWKLADKEGRTFASMIRKLLKEAIEAREKA